MESHALGKAVDRVKAIVAIGGFVEGAVDQALDRLRVIRSGSA